MTYDPIYGLVGLIRVLLQIENLWQLLDLVERRDRVYGMSTTGQQAVHNATPVAQAVRSVVQPLDLVVGICNISVVESYRILNSGPHEPSSSCTRVRIVVHENLENDRYS